MPGGGSPLSFGRCVGRNPEVGSEGKTVNRYSSSKLWRLGGVSIVSYVHAACCMIHRLYFRQPVTIRQARPIGTPVRNPHHFPIPQYCISPFHPRPPYSAQKKLCGRCTPSRPGGREVTSGRIFRVDHSTKNCLFNNFLLPKQQNLRLGGSFNWCLTDRLLFLQGEAERPDTKCGG